MINKFKYLKIKKKIFNLSIFLKNNLLKNKFSINFFIKKLKQKNYWFFWIKKKYVYILYFYFLKKNLFINFIKKNKIKIKITLGEIGFTGKNKLQKISILTTILTLFKKIKIKKKIYFALIYKGLNKYKFIFFITNINKILINTI